MKHVVLAAAVLALACLAAPPAAYAFSQEPVNIGTGDGSRLADPTETYRTRTELETKAPESDARRRFSLGVSGPDPRFAAPVERPGDDNRYLFWNNSSRYWR
jgi:hypothetical protein